MNTRDARGRWLKGHCPNPKGKPRGHYVSRYPNPDRLNDPHFRAKCHTDLDAAFNGSYPPATRLSDVLHYIIYIRKSQRIAMRKKPVPDSPPIEP
jgi:hypothetical protein